MDEPVNPKQQLADIFERWLKRVKFGGGEREVTAPCDDPPPIKPKDA